MFLVNIHIHFMPWNSSSSISSDSRSKNIRNLFSTVIPLTTTRESLWAMSASHQPSKTVWMLPSSTFKFMSCCKFTNQQNFYRLSRKELRLSETHIRGWLWTLCQELEAPPVVILGHWSVYMINATLNDFLTTNHNVENIV